MTWLKRDLRIIPVVLFATVALLALKTLGLLSEGGYAFMPGKPSGIEVTTPAPPSTVPSSEQVSTKPAAEVTDKDRLSWAQKMFNYPDYTGSVNPKPAEKPPEQPKKEAEKTTAPDKKAPPPAPDPNEVKIPVDGTRPLSPSERAVLERLAERHQELDQRARELEIRENLIKAAEKRIEARVGELKTIEARINATMQQRDKDEAARFKGLVSMYEGMKPKDAARIFDRLDINILVEVASQINPRRMSDILAAMSATAAEKLTVELARRASGTPQAKPQPAAELPKIIGRPNP